MKNKIVKLFPLEHRDRHNIAIQFDYDQDLKETVKRLGAKWSKTHACFYMENTTKNKQLIYYKLREKGCYVDYSAMPKAKKNPKKTELKLLINLTILITRIKTFRYP